MILKVIRKLNDKLIFATLGIIIPLFVMLPIIRVATNFFEPNSLYYATLISSNAITKSIFVTLELIIKVGFFSSLIGFSLAYIMTFYKVKFARIINILLIIPLCIPVYVAAYTYSNIFHFLPLLDNILRSGLFMNGSVFIYSMFLYPYVYLASKSYLSKNLTTYIEMGRTLGKSNLSIFLKIILPLSRPVIIGSVLFVLFETLSDFAVVEFYGVLSLSRYVNLSWFANGDFVSASKFSVYILIIMFVLIFAERFQRRNKSYSGANVVHKKYKKETPNIKGKISIYLILLTVILLSSILPITQMFISVFNNLDFVSRLNVLEITFNTLKVTTISIIIIVFMALLITTITIYTKGPKKYLLSGISTIGYMVPSMVLALGIYLLFIRFDQWFYRTFSNIGINRMIVTSTITILVIAFFIKFFSIAYTNLLAAYVKIDKNILDASETLGESRLSTLYRVSSPILKKSIISVSIILFIDMVKELTLVYSLRPFNFKTLSTEVYRYAGNEMINIAAFPSLIIIFICIIFVIYLEEGMRNDRAK